jgi:hypothetical protein
MKVRALLVGAGLAGLGGLALYDFNSPESRRERELHEIEKLKPDLALAECLPPGRLLRPFAAAVATDARPANTTDSDASRRGLVKHDCIRGAATHAALDRFVAATGEGAVPFAAAVIDRCKLDKNQYPSPACAALDVLGLQGGPAAVSALERVATERKAGKEVWLGATYRLLKAPAWRSPAELAELLVLESEWEAKELVLEKVREKRDASARAALTRAYAKEDDEGLKGRLKAALLELDNPGQCVAEDEGRAADGICRYFCRDANLRLRYPKDAKGCSLVRAPEPPAAQIGTASIGR